MAIEVEWLASPQDGGWRLIEVVATETDGTCRAWRYAFRTHDRIIASDRYDLRSYLAFLDTEFRGKMRKAGVTL